MSESCSHPNIRNAPLSPANELTSSTTATRPVASHERYLSLDALRGLSLLGVLLVNDLDIFRVSLFDQILVFHTHPGWSNRFVDAMVAGFLEFKAFGLFSLLFGMGIGIQTERLSNRSPDVYGFLARRFAVLLGFGILHMFLLFNGDILCAYAICGLLLIPLIECPAGMLAVLGISCLVLNFIGPFNGILPSARTMQTYATTASNAYAKGSFHELLVFRWHESWRCVIPLMLSVLLRTYGLMLLGIAVWRFGIFQKPEQHRRLLMAIALVSGTLGGFATGLHVFQASSGRPAIVSLPSSLIEACSSIPLAFAYAAMFLLWIMNRKSGNLLKTIAAVGQMALTNYLMQSVILGLIFYSYGLGLFGRLGSAPAALIGLSIYIIQMGFSRLWLRYHRFGPAEWLWRSLTYRKWQPMRAACEQSI